MNTKEIGVRVFHKRTMLRGLWGSDMPAPYDVEIEIDVDKIIRGLGAKARSNKSKKSKLLGIVVKVKPVRVDTGTSAA